MLAAGAAKSDRQITLALMNIVRQQIHQQFGNALDELTCLRERSNILRNPRVAPGQRSKLRQKMWIRQEPHIENQVGIFRKSVAEAKAHRRNQDALLRG